MNKCKYYSKKVLKNVLTITAVLLGLMIFSITCTIGFCDTDGIKNNETDSEVYDGSDNYVGFDDLFGLDTDFFESDIIILPDTDEKEDSDKSTDSQSDRDTSKETDTSEIIITDYDTDSDKQNYLLGDVDLSGSVNMLDVVHLQRAVAKLVELNSIQCVNADVNFDKIQNMQDVVLIQKYIAKLIAEF